MNDSLNDDGVMDCGAASAMAGSELEKESSLLHSGPVLESDSWRAAGDNVMAGVAAVARPGLKEDLDLGETLRNHLGDSDSSA